MKHLFATLLFLAAFAAQTSAAIWYVKSNGSDANTGNSWAAAFQNVQRAIGEGAEGDEIWVAEGTYLPTAMWDGNTARYKTFFLFYNMKLFGGFDGTETMRSQRDWVAHPTILSGDIGVPGDNSDNAYHVVWVNGRSSDMELDGFTITKGKSDFDNMRSSYGAGIYNTAENQASTPTIRNCTITGNTCASFAHGGGMFNFGKGHAASPTMTDCVFSNNTTEASGRGGGMANYASDMGGGASPVLTNCTFTNNSALLGGGAMSNFTASNGICAPLLTNCTFTNNSASLGGGAMNDNTESGGTCAPVLTNCNFTGNTTAAQSGGAIFHYGQRLTLNSCAFNNNTSLVAGGVNVERGTVTATGCTFSGNVSTNQAGALNLQGGINSCYFNSCTFTNNSAGTNGGGAVLYSDNYFVDANFDRCTFSGNSAVNGAAVYTEASGIGTVYTYLDNCLLFGNTASQRGGAFCSGPRDNTFGQTWLRQCTFYNNTAPAGGGAVGNSGVQVQQQTPRMYNCISWGNSSTFGQTAGGKGFISIEYSLIQEAACPTGAGCINGVIYNQNPLFVHAAANDFHLKNTSPAKNTGTNTGLTTDFDGTARPQGSGYDMGAFEVPLVCPGTVAYVDKDAVAGNNDGTSWANAFASLQDALDILLYCPNVQEIWVAEGTYLPTAPHGGATARHKTFFVNYDVKILGGFAGMETMSSQRNWTTHPTILSGDIGVPGDNSDNACHVVWIEGRSSAMELDGFTVTKGKLFASGDAATKYGAGIYNSAQSQNSSPTIRHCIITGNEGGAANEFGGGGGGMYNVSYNHDASPTLTDCTFSNNILLGSHEGGGMYSNLSSLDGICSPVLNNCSFTNNSASGGGGMYLSGFTMGACAPVLTNCSFTGNSVSSGRGGAIYGAYGQSVSLNNCTFTNNTSPNSGGALWMNRLTVKATDCTFFGNTATAGGGGAASISDSDNSSFTRCTFSNNTCPNGGAVRADNDAAPTKAISFHECTFSGNSAVIGGAVNYSSEFFTKGLNLSMVNCRLFNNTASLQGGAISSGASTVLTAQLYNCTFYNNTAPAGGGGVVGMGVVPVGQSPISMINCIAWGNSSTFGQTAGSQSGLGMAFCLIQEATCPTGATCGNGMIYNQNPLLVNAAANNFHLQGGSPAINSGGVAGPPIDFDGAARPQGAGYDMGAFERPFVCPGSVAFVDKDAVNGADNGTSWANAYIRLQDALDAATICPVEEIWVAEGTYLPTAPHSGGTDRHKTFFINYDVKIFGGFAGGETMRSQRNWTSHLTILSGDLGVANDISDNAYHVVWIEGRSSDMELDGFTITKGKLTLISDPTAIFGAGIYNNAENQHSTPTIRNCTITGNEGGTNTEGAGMFNKGYYYDASPTMTDCTFSNNTVPGNSNGGGMYNFAFGMGGICSPVLTNCVFTNNSAAFRGGAIYEKVENSGICAPVLTNCSFTGNTTTYQGGGGIYHSAGLLTLNNCTFTNNTAFIAGAASILVGSVLATDCTFSGNTATANSGAINLLGTDVTSSFLRCNFSNNSTMGNGGAILTASTTTSELTVQFDRCTFSGNSAVNGGALCTYGNPNASLNVGLTNCRLFGNTATGRGGAICSNRNDGGGYTGCNQCTFYNNTAPAGGGGAMGTLDWAATQLHPLWYNCIAWNNSSTFGQTASGQGALGITYSLIQEAACPMGAACGTGVIYNKNPLFVNAAANNFHLLACSPAVNTALTLPSVTIDFDGTARPQNGSYDMGVFEYVGVPCVLEAKCKNISVNLSAAGSVSVPAASIDNGSTGCNPQLLINNQAGQIYTCANIGSNVATLKATDCNNLTSTCTATVTVVDNLAPTIACPNSQTYTTTQCTATANYTTPTYTDNCTASVTLMSGLASGSAFPQGITTNVWKATDAGGLTATCSFTVTVTGGMPMTLACPANIAKNTDPNQCSAVTTYAQPMVSNPCGNVTLSLVSGLMSGDPFPKGATTVTWKATGSSTAMATCSFTVIVTDAQPPSITCPANIVRSTDAGQCSAAVTYANPTYSDNCPLNGPAGLDHLMGGLSNSSFQKGTTAITWQATDGAGLTKTCSFSITINDMQKPNITCPTNQTRSTDLGLCSAVVTYPTPTGTDNCGLPNGQPVWISGGTNASGSTATFPKGITTVTWRATDGAGNTQTCTFRVTVNDTEAPALTCPTAMNLFTATNTCSAVATYTNPTFTDNCAPTTGTATRISGLVSGSTFPVGNSNVVFQATDASGNTRRCTMVVTVTDNQLPAITCPEPIVVNGMGVPCTAAVIYGSAIASDNCAGTLTPFLVTGLASGSSFPAGVTTNTFRAVAPNGQSAECTFYATVNCGSGLSNTGLEDRNQDLEEQITLTQKTNLGLSIAPNPATYAVTVSMEGVDANGGTLLVFDQIGRLVHQQVIAHDQRTSTLQVAEFAPGLYRICLKTDAEMVTKILVVVK
jgi:predicted outer membrane repeat protein